MSIMRRIPSVLASLKTSISSDVFITSPVSMASPVYIVRQGIFKVLGEIAPTLKGNILDFGCGSKPYESLFINSQSYIGVDIEQSGHDHTSSKVDFYYDGKTLPFEDSSFDVIVSFEVLEHVFNIEEVLLELQRVLTENGQLLISVPFVWNEHEIPYDYARYTSFGITHILNKNGFQVIDLRKTTTYFLTIGQILIAYLSQHLLPKGRVLGALSKITIVFPTTLLLIAMNRILPKNYDLFCNSVILCQKKT
jgi:SAM-dependent methyltransferase